MSNPPDRAAQKAARRSERARQRRADAYILGPVSARLTAASALIALSSACAVVPFILIAELCRELLTGSGDPSRMWAILYAALAILGVRGLLSSAAFLWSHMIDAEHQFTLRQLLAANRAGRA